MGFQARGEAWRYNLDTLLSFKVPGDDQGEVLACWLDNRGVGETSHPKDKKAYSTKHMADDALALMDHIGWDKAHVFGHSMGGMIACKLASTAPERVQSLALLGVTGGNWQAIGSIVRKLPGLLKHHVMTARTAEQKARATLYCHFSRRWLKQAPKSADGDSPGPESRRKEELIQEYMADAKAYKGRDLSTPHGADGQASAVFRHTVTKEEMQTIKSGGFPILVIHGRKDVIAHIKYAEKLAKRLDAPMIVTSAGHFITRESLEEVNAALLSLLARVHIIGARTPRTGSRQVPPSLAKTSVAVSPVDNDTAAAAAVLGGLNIGRGSAAVEADAPEPASEIVEETGSEAADITAADASTASSTKQKEPCPSKAVQNAAGLGSGSISHASWQVRSDSAEGPGGSRIWNMMARHPETPATAAAM
eukprot:CAMPEP_0117677746 /NCGR_PEP_ID=MMETSP0804-20121206/16908_1 /TAXON_ID=1074897 /ORGANISM="Tetraselmis astigmatica, Strain CCMP880" /LENGTH=420 /DNA_ID=CAMNT_0005487047 /DNA_START=259 /DNA_END=1521 /DNA_ORIENTATION=+